MHPHYSTGSLGQHCWFFLFSVLFHCYALISWCVVWRELLRISSTIHAVHSLQLMVDVLSLCSKWINDWAVLRSWCMCSAWIRVSIVVGNIGSVHTAVDNDDGLIVMCLLLTVVLFSFLLVRIPFCLCNQQPKYINAYKPAVVPSWEGSLLC